LLQHGLGAQIIEKALVANDDNRVDVEGRSCVQQQLVADAIDPPASVDDAARGAHTLVCLVEDRKSGIEKGNE
jgi:hypothetical protein